MKVFDGNWQAFLARTLVFGVVVFGAVKLAGADPGGPTSPNSLTYSGVLRNLAGTGPLSGAVILSFALRRTDGTSCPPVMVSTTANANGAFSALVSTAGCPSGFFNGDAITYDVNLVSPSGEAGPLTPDGGVAVTPVPYARFADQAGVNNDCPPGYERVTDTYFTPDSDRRLCQKSRMEGATRIVYDEVVRVGRGSSAFWIDRWEATITERDIGGTRYGQTRNDYPVPEFPDTGQWTEQRFALSMPRAAADHVPSRFVTWFQASAACRISGKRLPNGEEWLAAANGTPDSGAFCNMGTTIIRAPESSGCRSRWGAQDMVGNLMEWTTDWYASIGQTTTVVGADAGTPATATAAFQTLRGVRVNDISPWPTGFGDGDITRNVTAVVNNGGTHDIGIPAAAIRGGRTQDGRGAGVFAMDLGAGPSVSDSTIGFRCVTPR